MAKFRPQCMKYLAGDDCRKVTCLDANRKRHYHATFEISKVQLLHNRSWERNQLGLETPNPSCKLGEVHKLL